MKLKFIDSDMCMFDGKFKYYFWAPQTLRDRILEKISTIGSKKFLKSPDKSIKKEREGLAEYLFLMGLRKLSNQEWFILQPEKDPPDFEIISIGEKLLGGRFELVEIPAVCKGYEEMFNIWEKKKNKGYPKDYSLLIFINNASSRVWLDKFTNDLLNYKPFREIWVLYLLWYRGGKDFYGGVVERVRPYPIIKIDYNISDQNLIRPLPMPCYVSEVQIDGKKFYNLDPPIKELIKIKNNQNLGRG